MLKPRNSKGNEVKGVDMKKQERRLWGTIISELEAAGWYWDGGSEITRKLNNILQAKEQKDEMTMRIETKLRF